MVTLSLVAAAARAQQAGKKNILGGSYHLAYAVAGSHTGLLRARVRGQHYHDWSAQRARSMSLYTHSIDLFSQISHRSARTGRFGYVFEDKHLTTRAPKVNWAQILPTI